MSPWKMMKRIGFFTFFVKPAGFGAVAAVAHVAPAPAAVTADVQKQPSTGRVRTFFYAAEFF
jgi:hypothetical protein